MRLLVVVEHALVTSQRATSTPCLRRWPQAPACLLWLVPLWPLLAAALISVRLFLWRNGGDAGEPITAGIASAVHASAVSGGVYSTIPRPH